MEKLERLRGAISRLLAAETKEEQEAVLEKYPELISPKALAIIDSVIDDFAQTVTVIDDFPATWRKRREFLASKSKG